MKTKTDNYKTVLFGLSLGLTPLYANAVNLNVGDTQSLPGTTFAAEAQLGGTVLVDEDIPFSLNGITGHVQQRIVRSSQDGTLDFYWRVFNDANSTAPIGSFRVGDFLAPEYNANWRIDGLGDLEPNSAKRLSWGNINFLFDARGGELRPGQSSKLFFFDTTATDYGKTAFFDLTGTGSGNISKSFPAYTPVFKPTTTPVPQSCENSSYSNGLLHIPSVSVADGFGGISYYKVDMKLKAVDPLIFEVTDANRLADH